MLFFLVKLPLSSADFLSRWHHVITVQATASRDTLLRLRRRPW